eukprot:TRINITY_DN62_c0_g1_i1.p1 TRINITY_DN62_c0_g1~~TRINITY_DN62_c0_g1_i1.p1  ORF type:complete len:331 (-),score=92.22 TRINITY_DN62_c0_g1_i1:82-1074(-)
MASNKKAKAIYSYQGERPSDLSFQAGDIINVVAEMSPSGPEWWEGELYGRRGAFPLNHVEILVPNKKGEIDYGGSTAAPGLIEPKIGKPERPELFQCDHLAWKIALGFSIVAMIAMLIALIMPWYFIARANVNILEFQPFGTKVYSQSQLGNPRAVVISTTPQYDVYDADKEPIMKKLHLLSFLLNLFAYFTQFVITILLFVRIRGYLQTVFYLPILSLASFLMIMIAPLNYAASINNAIGEEIIKARGDPVNDSGPRTDFFGTREREQTIASNGTILGFAGTETWGPTAAWVFAIIAIVPSFACYMALFLIVLGRRILCCGYKLKGGSR